MCKTWGSCSITTMTAPKSFSELPSFDELDNKGRYWVWGEAGSRNEGLGMFNLLTPEHVAKVASQEIRTGRRTGLGWEFHHLENPSFNRTPFQMKVIALGETAFDDEYHLNPQQSSQWDGFRHHSQPSLQFGTDSEDKHVWYGGTRSSEITAGSSRIGIQHWAKEGIVARGVLLDYAGWAKANGVSYSCFSIHTITLTELKKVIEFYNVEIQPGDILFLRIGLPEEWYAMSEDEKLSYQNLKPPQHAGVEQSEEMLRWIWNSHFCAVASDTVSFEVYPAQNSKYKLHNYLLAGWGVPIGEMFDLDSLASICHELNRYSFFVSSVPFNAVGAVSSPPNAVAIF